MTAATLTIGIDPTIQVGPVELAWHGIMTAVGLAIAIPIAQRHAANRGRDPDVVLRLALIVIVAGFAGARLLWLVEHPGELARPGGWLGSQGYSIYGAVIGGLAAAVVWQRRHGLELAYVDSLAFAFPAAMAIGRIGDLINGEHYGPASDVPWAIRYSHPEALTPTHDVAYHPGGLYEIALAMVMLALLWPLRRRLQAPGLMLWAVVALYALGRLAMFTWRSDSPDAAVAGLSSSQLISVMLLGVAAAGLTRTRLRRDAARTA